MQETNAEVEALRNKIATLEIQLKAETENNIKLEQYTRRENLRFNNIQETEDEDCKTLIYYIIQNEMGIDTSNIGFHAVHRVGREIEGRCGPIIARFISHEDRDVVCKNRSRIKNSDNHTNAYITEDYARAIQEERKVLIKAMIKAREEQGLTTRKLSEDFYS